MKTSLPAFVANAAAHSPREPLKPDAAEKESQSFDEHLDSAAGKRSHGKSTTESKSQPGPAAVKSASQDLRREQAKHLERLSPKTTERPKAGLIAPRTPQRAIALKEQPGTPAKNGARGSTRPAASSAKQAKQLTSEEVAIVGLPANEPKPLPEQPSLTSLLNVILEGGIGITPLIADASRLRIATEATERVPPATTSAAISSEPGIESGPPENQTSLKAGDAAFASPTAENIRPEFASGESAEFSQVALEQDPIESGEKEGPPDWPIISAAAEKETPPRDGTAVAKQTLSMKNTVEMDKVAGPAGKNLPGTERTLDLPAAQLISRVEKKRDARDELPRDATAFATTVSSAAVLRAEDTTPVANVPAVERLARAVLDGVAHLRQTRNESVSVVLKPDAGTELLLRVEMRDGAISAQLHFERGGSPALDQHWDELQRRLAEHGVRLNRGDAAGFNSDAQSQRRSFVPDRNPDPIFFPGAGAKKTSSDATITRRRIRGFETWA